MTPEEQQSYMLRREGILEVLRSLIGHWELAEGLTALIGSSYVTLEMIDGIEKILRDAIVSGKNSHTKAKLEMGLSAIMAIKQKELEERRVEQDSLDSRVLEQFI